MSGKITRVGDSAFVKFAPHRALTFVDTVQKALGLSWVQKLVVVAHGEDLVLVREVAKPLYLRLQLLEGRPVVR